MDKILKVSSNDFRKDIYLYFKEHKGETVYITKRNKVVAEVLFYSSEDIDKLELKMAKMIVDSHNRKSKITRNFIRTSPVFPPGHHTPSGPKDCS